MTLKTLSYTSSNFSRGRGVMSQAYFDYMAETYGVFQAVWVAKYFGVALNSVKIWTKKHLH